jgi:hypothetical protein
MYLPRDEKDSSMNLRRIFKPIAAAILTVGLVTAAVAPADAAVTRKSPSTGTYDTGWGFK